jgi:hypothetical protein
MRQALVPLLVLGLLALPACTKQLEAPTDRGVCWHMAQLQGGKVRFNRLAVNVDTIEKCAVQLEAMRERFLALGGSNTDIIGAYQGQFLFLQPEGIFISQSLTGGRYLLLVRAGNGQLAKPGSVPAE